ncbi:MAG: hypothetical protein WEC37_04980, partial [Anaerolineales bacterium]
MSYHSAQDPEEKLPDWLKELRKRQAEAGNSQQNTDTPPVEVPAAEEEKGASDEEPSWLKDIRQRYKREQPQEEAKEEARALSDTQPTSPVKPLEKRRLEKAGENKEATPVEPVSKEPAQVPDWLTLDESEEQAADAFTEPPSEPEIQTRAFSQGEGETLSPGEIPSWLQAIRPGGTFPEEDTRSAEMLPQAEETAGPLAGLSGILPAEPEIVRVGKPPVFSARVDITEGQARHAAAFSQLVANEAQPKEDATHRVALPTRVLNWTIAAVILLATLFPLILQSQGAPRPELNAIPESAEVFNIIDVLPPDAPVLVAFEVQPSLFGEVQAPAAAVLRHLLDKQARLVFISTQATGPALAEKLLQEQLSELPSVATQDYINLGYLSGGM